MYPEQTMQHTPMTEEEALGLLPAGNYEGHIRCVEVKKGRKDPSKSYFVATVDVYDSDGRPVSLITWLALPSLLKHMYDAAGQEDKYKETTLSTKDCEGANVVVKIKVTIPTDDYPTPRNQVVDFLKPKASVSVTKQQLIDEVQGFNDPVGF